MAVEERRDAAEAGFVGGERIAAADSEGEPRGVEEAWRAVGGEVALPAVRATRGAVRRWRRPRLIGPGFDGVRHRAGQRPQQLGGGTEWTRR